MDPNANLAEQLQVAKGILATPEHQSYGAVRLAELVEALDEWLVKGGFFPDRWRR